MAASLDAGPCLEDILSHYGLEKKDLERPCPSDIRISIAVKLVDWKTTGRYLGVPLEKLAAIGRENTTEDQRRIALLDCWEEREGRNASCLKLADVLYRRERRDLVELLCVKIKASTSLVRSKRKPPPLRLLTSDEKRRQPFIYSVDIVKRIDALQKQFRGLHRQFLLELNERGVSVDDVLAELTLLPIECCKEYENSIQKMLPKLEKSARVRILFNRLNPLFTFIDYGLLHHLISNLGSTELEEDMASYIGVVKEFMRVTTVGDVMDHWPGVKESHVNYSELRIKFRDDPKTYTLERLNIFRRKFCSEVRLSEFIFGLISLEPSESFFVTWLIPTVVVPELNKSVCQVEYGFYEPERILSISVDQEQLYPPSYHLNFPVLVQSLRQKQPKVSPAGDLITSISTLTLKSTMVKKDVQPKLSTADTVNIIVVGWDHASEFVQKIIGRNKDNSLKLYDYSDKVACVFDVTDKEEFVKQKREELQTKIQTCQNPSLVLFFNPPLRLWCFTCSAPNRQITVGFTVADLTTFLGHSIWNNAVIVQPFEMYSHLSQDKQSMLYQAHLKEENIKPKYRWRDIDPEVVSNIPAVPVGIPELPDRIDWLSPFWDICLLRMKETAQHAFLNANADRIKLAATGQKREGSYPIYYVPGPNTSKAPIRSAISSLLGTEVAGPLGTTVIELHHQDKDTTSLADKKTT